MLGPQVGILPNSHLTHIIENPDTAHQLGLPIAKLLERQRCHPFFLLFIFFKIIFVLLLLPYDFSDEVRALLGVSLPF